MFTISSFVCFIIVLSQSYTTSSFQLNLPRTSFTSISSSINNNVNHQHLSPVLLHGTMNQDDEGDFGNTGNSGAGGDSYEGDIDWDAEW